METRTSDLSAWLNTLPIPKRLAKLAAVIVPLTLFSICFLLLTLPPQGNFLHSQSHTSDPSARREAYVTFLSSTKKRGYADSVRLLLFALKHDPELRDPLDRDFIVVTTRYTSPEVKSQLAKEGAIIRDTPLITGMPQLEHYKTADDHSYRDVFTKLAIWNMTEYDRMFYLDSDMLVLKEIWSLWDMPGSDPPSGLAAFSDVLDEHKVPPADRDYFNAGALILRPDAKRYEELLNSLLNEYYRWDGPNPWSPLPHIYINMITRPDDISGGIHILHDKLWRHEIGGAQTEPYDRKLTELWRRKFGRIEGWWLAQDELEDGPEV